MKKYNIRNYVRYKNDVASSLKKIDDRYYHEYERDELIIKFLPLVENLARKFSTSQQASGVIDITDLIQEGSAGLIAAVDRIVWPQITESEDPEKTLKSFLSKRIRGAIRRRVDMNRGTMRIPEHKLNEIRKDFGEDKKAVSLFFNSVFLSLDIKNEETNMAYDIPDKTKAYNKDILLAYIKGIMMQHLNHKEYQVLRLSYGLDCERYSAKKIAEVLGIKGTSSYVRISQLKKNAIQKLIDSVPYSQVVDYL